MVEAERYITAREVAGRLGLSPGTILRYYRDGLIPGRRLPGQIRLVRFLWSEVDAAWDLHGPSSVREGSAEAVSEDGAVAAARSSTRARGDRAGVLDAAGWRPVPVAGRRSDRYQQLSPSRLDAGSGGRRAQASPDLRPAPHVCDVVACGGRGHLQAVAPDGDEPADDRSHLRHLAAGADVWERELLDGFDERGVANGRYLGAEIEEEETS
jgi:predicted DNA-binding transcriptional regulator AlpA